MSDVMLCIGMPVVIVTGILMAKELFLFDLDLPWDLIFTFHNVCSYICLGAIAAHIVLHGK